MPVPPPLTPAQRAQASARAARARAVRARLRDDLAGGTVGLSDALARAAGDGEEATAVAAMRVRVLLESLPGVGARRAEQAMVAARVGPGRRVRGTGPVQRAALVAALGGAGGPVDSPSVPPPARLTVLSGPSGVGKGTVVRAARELAPRLWVSVSCTTRPPRPGETDGVEYFFCDRAQFRAAVAGGDMLEWAEFAGNLYGTPRGPVEARLADGVPVVLEIDLQGARQVRAAMPGARLVFLAPPSDAELERRLTGRATEDPAAVAVRRAAAADELAAAGEFDHVVVNDDVRRAAAELVGLVDSAVS